MGQLERNKDLPPTPWRAIIVSAPMLALIAAQVGHDWGFFIMVTDLPKYMSDVLRFSIKDNGIYSAVPYIFMWVVSILTGFLSDWLIVKRYLNITNARKVFTGVGTYWTYIRIDASTSHIYLHIYSWFIYLSCNSAGHIHRCCIVCWLWQNAGRHLVHSRYGFHGHILSRHESKSVRFESKLCRLYYGIDQWSGCDHWHRGTISSRCYDSNGKCF